MKHGEIIVGVDFDDTLFPFNKDTAARCKIVRDELITLKDNCKVVICLNTVADKQSLVYKEYIMSHWGLKPDFINESPIKKWGDCSKPYFNIYIDDKSGINEMIKVLIELNKKLEL